MEEAKAEFHRIYRQLESVDQENFIRWIEEEFMNNNRLIDSNDDSTLPITTTTEATNRTANAEVIMRAAAEDIRNKLPIDAVLKSETILVPEAAAVAGANDADAEAQTSPAFEAATSVHVDSFLYDDDAIDDLVEEGKFSRHYCTKCMSR